MIARCVMVLGTTSGAGKSFLATALCRWYARQGYKVAPFKAQNLSNNARVVVSRSGGLGEIGSAQYFQALASFNEPNVKMNPLLIKPDSVSGSQVVLLGDVNHDLTHTPWQDRSEQVWPTIAESLDDLRKENDIVVIEGAGSPAEINLSSKDIVNLRVARYANARCLLITDIDRGGAFAHLYGTWALLSKEDRAYINGFILNKFRGNPDLLAPAPEMLQTLTGVPLVGVLPMWKGHGLPEEDGLFDTSLSSIGQIKKTIAIIAYPYISNLDEFQVLKNLQGVCIVWARSVSDIKGLGSEDWIILPGSKSTISDLRWLRHQGLDIAINQHVQSGGFVLGICGGLQMLGEALIDAESIDGNAPGLGLLPLITCFGKSKTVKRTQCQLGHIQGCWNVLSNTIIAGYEIHQGSTLPHDDLIKAGHELYEIVPDLFWQNQTGQVVGTYLHGLFENPSVLRALFGRDANALDDVFEGLANYLDSHIKNECLLDLIKV